MRHSLSAFAPPFPYSNARTAGCPARPGMAVLVLASLAVHMPPLMQVQGARPPAAVWTETQRIGRTKGQMREQRQAGGREKYASLLLPSFLNDSMRCSFAASLRGGADGVRSIPSSTVRERSPCDGLSPCLLRTLHIFPIVCHVSFCLGRFCWNMTQNAEHGGRLQAAKAFCFDVDSTVITTESIDELAETCGAKEQVEKLTIAAMAGSLPFHESLRRRLAIIQPRLQQVCDHQPLHAPLHLPFISPRRLSLFPCHSLPLPFFTPPSSQCFCFYCLCSHATLMLLALRCAATLQIEEHCAQKPFVLSNHIKDLVDVLHSRCPPI
jgi:hypothetical protein